VSNLLQEVAERLGESSLNAHMWAALDYAAAGFAVFPCVPRAKAPLTAHGWQDASTDPYLIRHWWERWPRANVAISCGRVSGVIVLDFDTKGGGNGYQTLTKLIEKAPQITNTPSVSTPSGGVHMYFNWNPDSSDSWWKDGPLGLEYKTNGSYVLAPPSVVAYADTAKNAGAPPTGFYVGNGPLTRDRFLEVPF